MLEAKIPDEHRSWDRFGAFHCGVDRRGFSSTNHYNAKLVVLFDTGEVILTYPRPDPDVRGLYEPLGIEVTTSKDLQVYLPDGTRCAKAWLDDGGMQYLVHDLSTGTAVRLDGRWRQAPNQHTKGTPITPGIPTRFQYNCYTYFPGPGLRPVSPNPIKIKRPLRSAKFTPEQMDHIHMIVATGQAAMKLTNHPALNRAGANLDPNVVLNCKTWMDVPDEMLPHLAKQGCTHFVEEYGYLSTTGLD